MTKLVIIDFWAEWCGPCKALTPVLEKVAADYADKGVVLAKVDTDKNQFIAAQFQIKSIPTVYAMFQGQLVADLTTARTESQLKAMLDQLLQAVAGRERRGADAEAELEPLIAMGEQVLAEGDAERALSIFEQIAEMAPDIPGSLSGRIRALVAAGRVDEARSRARRAARRGRQGARDRARACGAGPRALRAAGRRPGAAGRGGQGRARRPAGALRPRQRADGGGRSRCARRIPAHIVASRPRLERGRGAAAIAEAVRGGRAEDPWVSAQRRRLSAILFT